MPHQQLKFLTLIPITILGILFLNLLKEWGQHYCNTNLKNIWKSETCVSFETLSELRNQLLVISKHIVAAHRYARSSKTMAELDKTFEIMSEILELGNNALISLNRNKFISPNQINTFSEIYEPDVCPEIWVGTEAPYLKGYEMNCSGLSVKPFETVLTIILNFVSEAQITDWAVIAEGLSKTQFRNLTIVGGVTDADKAHFEKLAEKYQLRAESVVLDSSCTLGKSINKILDRVHTKYVLVTRDLVRFNEFSRLERLVRLLSYIDADFVSGSQRNSTGHWELGCYQMTVKNYTMRLVEGYDLSYNSCIYCDYISGPFAVRTQTLKFLIDDSMNGEPFYANLWLKAWENRVILNCPDAMFHSREIGLSVGDRSHWLPLAQKHKLNRLIFPESRQFKFTCREVGVVCSWAKKGLALPICCLEELTNLLVSTVSILEENGVQYELDSGTKLGAVKMGATIPWELDHDVLLRSQNVTAVAKLVEHFKELGLQLYADHQIVYPICLNRSRASGCGYFGVRSGSWRLELYGVFPLRNDIWNGEMPSTKAKVAGHWMNIYPNPALAARNKFKDDIFKHVEHPSTLGRRGVKPGVFSPCPQPGFHGCLKGNYVPVGNIQFKDTWI